MKKIFYATFTIFISVSIFALFSCQTSKVIKDSVNISTLEDDVYESKTNKSNEKKVKKVPVKLINKTEKTDFLFFDIKYPVFENYDFFNKVIYNASEAQLNQFKDSAEKEWMELKESSDQDVFPPFEYTIDSTYIETDDYLSVLLNTYIFNGGAHGNYILSTYNLHKETKQLCNISDVSRKTYEQLSNICRTQLIEKIIENTENDTEISLLKKMIYDGTSVNPGNFEIFTISDSGITIYFEPYSVAPYSYGIQSVEIKN